MLFSNTRGLAKPNTLSSFINQIQEDGSFQIQEDFAKEGPNTDELAF